MKTSQSLQLLDTNDVNISPIIGVESLFYEKDDGTNIVKRKTLHDKMLFSEKDGSLSISQMSYDDASNLSIIVDLSTYVNEGDNPSLHRLGVSVVSMQDFMGVIDEKIEQGGGGGGFDPTNINASIRDISNRLSNLSDNVDTIGQSVDDLDDKYNELNTSFGILDTSVGILWDSSMSGGGDASIKDIKIQDQYTSSHSIVNQTTKIADISIKTINNQSLIGLGNITISGGDASIYDIRVGDSQQTVVDGDKIARIFRSDFISDASVDAWNNGGLISGQSTLGSINGDPFVYGTNITISGLDDVRDIKYGQDLQMGWYVYGSTQTSVSLSSGQIIAYHSGAGGGFYMPIDASGKTPDDYSFVIDIDKPIFISNSDVQIKDNNPNFDDAYICKTNIDLKTPYKLPDNESSGSGSSNKYMMFPQMYNVYLKGKLFNDISTLIELDATNLIVDDSPYPHRNIIDKNDTEKLYKYIHIGYTYTENFKQEQAGGTPNTTSKIHFYGGLPRVYYYDSTAKRLEPYNVKLNMVEDALFSLQGSIASDITPRVDTLENSVSTIENSISTIESSVNKLEKSVYNVDYHYDLDTSLSSWSYLFALLNDPQKMAVGVEREGILSGINILNIDLNQFWESRAVHEDTNYKPTVPLTIYLDDILFGDTDDMIADTFGKYGEKELEIRFIEDASLDSSITQVFRFAKITNDSSITLSYRYGQKTSDSSFNIISLHKNELGYVKIRRIPDFSDTGVYKGHYIINFN